MYSKLPVSIDNLVRNIFAAFLLYWAHVTYSGCRLGLLRLKVAQSGQHRFCLEGGGDSTPTHAKWHQLSHLSQQIRP